MTKTTENLFLQAMELAEPERAEFASRLLESIDSAMEAQIDEVWRAEIRERLRRIDAGEAQWVSWPDVRNRLQARLDGGS